MSRPHSNGLSGAFDACALLAAPRLRRRASAEWFWAKVDRASTPDGCWPWLDWNEGGYGRVTWCGVEVGAHRVSYSLTNGPIGAGAVVRHKCDNPICVRPDHLEVGTIADNNADTRARGRARTDQLVRVGVANCNAKLTDDLVRGYRAAWAAGESIKSIVARSGLAVGTIHPMLHGRTWGHVKPAPLPAHPLARGSR